MLSLPLFFFYVLLNFLIPRSCLPVSFSFPKSHSQHSFSCFLAFPLFCPNHQSPGHLLSKRFLTACLLQFPPSYLWVYFLCFFLFHHKSHFAYHHTVLFCDTLIHYYLTIAHFLQVPPSAHHIIYLGTFSSTFIRHPVLIFLLEISVDNRQIHPFSEIHNH